YDSTNKTGDQGFKTINVTEAVHPYVGAWWPSGHIIGYEHTFVHAIHDFLVALENDTMPSPNFTDGVKNQIVMEAIEKSAKSGKWEKIEK
ncbi:MAG TPA: gfo/Idh/MocA family oxidoreductase, partial [Terriglobia bacterium]|nr:gfo/Idh/MocA family oxidoreductase [Terriglobia bacterium]